MDLDDLEAKAPPWSPSPMASDPTALAHELIEMVETCESTDAIVARVRAILTAARAEERAACVDLCRARVDSLTEECLRLKWDDDRRAELTARAEGAYDCAEAIRGRG